ncbi:MAG TPA: hypothetical protein VM100_11195, partial [Longimicrobiales bacterium]|nr:hypothetical protein [Longimicrobiales bacterium]
EVVKDETGEVIEQRCSYDADTRGGDAKGRAVKGTIQWLSAAHALNCEVRLYDRLFGVTDPDAGGDFKAALNPDSLAIVGSAFVEASIKNDPPGSRYQFERVGYFVSDFVDSSAQRLVFNRTVTLRDSWAKASGQSVVDEGRPKRDKRAGEKREQRSRPSVARSPELVKRGEVYVREYGIDAVDAEALTRDAATAELFEGAVAGNNAKAIAKLIINDVFARVEDFASIRFSPKQLASLVVLVEGGTISSTAAKEVLAEMVVTGGEPAEIVERLALSQISDANAITPIVVEIVSQNKDKADAYRSGRAGLLGFFVGQVMARTGGRANPEMVKEIVEKQLA